MKKTVLLISFFLAFGSAILTAQEKESLHPCGTSDEISPWLIEYQNNTAAYKTLAGIIYVPLTVHLVGQDNETGYFSVQRTLDALCTLNNDFEPSEIQFFLANEFNYIPNSEWYDHEDYGPGYDMMNSSNFDNSLNAYIVANPAGNCGYYAPGGDAVALGRSCMGPNDHTWAHEMGHYLSLPHTFSGWEGYDHDYNEPAPTTLRGRQVEKVDRSNCRNAGDRFCDTPADYLNFRWSCDENGESRLLIDPNNTEFRADGTLFMSYSNDACASRFSDEQIAAMRANLQSDRDDLPFLLEDPGFIDPNTTIVLSTPAENELVNPEEVTLSWEPVENATSYIVEGTIFNNTFSLIDFVRVVNTNSVVLENLKPGRTYYWRIRPYSAYSYCKFFSATGTFKTDVNTSLKQIPGIKSLEIFPTLASAGQSTVQVKLISDARQKLITQLVDVSGKIHSTEVIALNSGESKFEISIENLPAGFYFLRFQNENGVTNRRIVIQ